MGELLAVFTIASVTIPVAVISITPVVLILLSGRVIRWIALTIIPRLLRWLSLTFATRAPAMCGCPGRRWIIAIAIILPDNLPISINSNRVIRLSCGGGDNGCSRCW